MGGLCSRRRADDADGHDADSGAADVDDGAVASDVVASSDADAADSAAGAVAHSPCSPHLAPAPSWGRSFLEGRELRQRANVDSRSIELQQ